MPKVPLLDDKVQTPPPPLRWDDADRARAWVTDLREQILDALAAGEDAARPARRRVLSRAEAGRKLRAAKRSILALLDAAEAGLPARQSRGAAAEARGPTLYASLLGANAAISYGAVSPSTSAATMSPVTGASSTPLRKCAVARKSPSTSVGPSSGSSSGV